MRRGRGFSYRTATGAPVDAETLERIEQLAIPPAWTDVWICPWPNGHIQALGTDAAGRRQYLYHQDWRAHRDREKFDRVLTLGRSIADLRAKVTADLEAGGMGKERVLAATVRLLDIGCFRIGGEAYAAEHDTFGLATMRKEHVKVRGPQMVFSYPAKGSKWVQIAVREPAVLPVVRALVRRRGGGDDLFAYKEKGRWVDVRSDDVNAYIKEAAGGDYSAKDFRTWSATVLAAARLAEISPPPASVTARRRAVARVVRDVADHLGNTPAVCRSSYIDPRVLDRFDGGATIRPALAAVHDPAALDDESLRNSVDRAVVALIDGGDGERRAA